VPTSAAESGVLSAEVVEDGARGAQPAEWKHANGRLRSPALRAGGRMGGTLSRGSEPRATNVRPTGEDVRVDVGPVSILGGCIEITVRTGAPSAIRASAVRSECRGFSVRPAWLPRLRYPPGMNAGARARRRIAHVGLEKSDVHTRCAGIPHRAAEAHSRVAKARRVFADRSARV